MPKLKTIRKKTKKASLALTLENLLGRGYFPSELPPPFSTGEFAALVGKKKSVIPREFQWFRKNTVPDSAELGVFNMMRPGGLRRSLGIPNPVHFYRASDYVVTNFRNLQPLAQLSPYSLTKPAIKASSRGLSPEIGFNDIPARRSGVRALSRFLLKADISRFYHSVYTHSVPWAIHGKSTVKTAMRSGTLKQLYGDGFDGCLRNLNDSQTVGIPIGPDISLLAAEIILGDVDSKFALKFPAVKGIRNVDDYELGFRTLSEAEAGLSHLQELLSEYELALNPRKTSIIELPEPYESLWISELRIFRFRPKGERSDLVAYFDLVFDYAKKYPHERVFHYAIARLSSFDVAVSNWELFENFLLQAAGVEPSCLPQIADQVARLLKKGSYGFNDYAWEECLNTIIIDHVSLGHHSEAVWAMWILRLLELELSSDAEDLVCLTEESCTALMALGLASLRLADMTKLQKLSPLTDSANLYSRSWLVCYEATLRGWLTPPSGPVTDPVFSFIANNNVSFFDINVQHPVRPNFSSSASGDYRER